jgi:hypothetical protein
MRCWTCTSDSPLCSDCGPAGRAPARAAVHATFGLLNSTPRSTSELTRAAMADLLHAMAARAAGAS